MLEYDMVFFTLDGNLTQLRELLKSGWELYGHPFAVYDATIGGDRVAQALTRKTYKEDDKVSIDKTAGK